MEENTFRPQSPTRKFPSKASRNSEPRYPEQKYPDSKKKVSYAVQRPSENTLKNIPTHVKQPLSQLQIPSENRSKTGDFLPPGKVQIPDFSPKETEKIQIPPPGNVKHPHLRYWENYSPRGLNKVGRVRRPDFRYWENFSPKKGPQKVGNVGIPDFRYWEGYSPKDPNQVGEVDIPEYRYWEGYSPKDPNQVGNVSIPDYEYWTRYDLKFSGNFPKKFFKITLRYSPRDLNRVGKLIPPEYEYWRNLKSPEGEEIPDISVEKQAFKYLHQLEEDANIRRMTMSAEDVSQLDLPTVADRAQDYVQDLEFVEDRHRRFKSAEDLSKLGRERSLEERAYEYMQDMQRVEGDLHRYRTEVEALPPEVVEHMAKEYLQDVKRKQKAKKSKIVDENFLPFSVEEKAHEYIDDVRRSRTSLRYKEAEEVRPSMPAKEIRDELINRANADDSFDYFGWKQEKVS